MLKILYTSIFILLVGQIQAQNVGIGTNNPNNSAKLEITANDRGVLIPRISIPNLTAATPVTSPVVSLLVYNTNVTSGLGYHYWDGTQWVKLLNQNDVDHDWYEAGTTTDPNDINNNIYTQGNVGIGTTNPSKNLHLSGQDMGGSAGFGILLANTGFLGKTFAIINSNDGYIHGAGKFIISGGNASNPRIIIDSLGAVGIGIISPTQKLDIDGQTRIRQILSGTASTDVILVTDVNGVVKKKTINALELATTDTLEWGDAGSYIFAKDARLAGNEVRISDGGELGLGTNPSATIDVASSSNGSSKRVANFKRTGTGAAGLGLFFTHGASAGDYNPLTREGDMGLFFDRDGNQAVDDASRGLLIAPWSSANSGSTGLKITENGNIGLGIPVPEARLHVAARGNGLADYTAKFTSSPSVAGAGGIVFTNTEATTATGFKIHTAGTGTATYTGDNFVLSSVTMASGAVNQDNIFNIRGDGRIGLGVVANTGAYIRTTSGAILSNGGAWTNSSDRRLKKNIINSKYGLATVLSLRSVDYTMIKGGEKQVGFIAQELQQIIPEVVYGIEGDLEKGETLSVSYDQLVPVLVNAIKEQQATIEQQSTDQQTLKEMIEKLQKQVAILEQNNSTEK